MNEKYPIVSGEDVAWISEQDMVKIDRTMIDDLRIDLIQMMENAGRNLARLVFDTLSPERVVVAAGSGGNGGGGLVAARHLANAGAAVKVATTRPGNQLDPVPAHQFDILTRMGVEVVDSVADAEDVDVIIDAVIGFSLRGAPKGRSAEFIAQIMAARSVADTESGGESDIESNGDGKRGLAVVSLDNPSGLNVTTGETPGVIVDADATLTLCLPKTGLRAAREVGDLYLADISVPPSVTSAYGRSPDFRPGSILRIV